MSASPVVLVPLAEGEFRPLAKEFRQDGFDLTQEKREKDVAIYVKSKPGIDAEWYEVVVIKGRKAYTIGGNFVEAAEVYPSNESWGSLGWTFNDYQEAYRKFCNLLRVRK